MSEPTSANCERIPRWAAGATLASLALFIGVLAHQSRLWPDTVDDAHVVPAPPSEALGWYWVTFSLAWAMLTVLALHLARKPRHKPQRESASVGDSTAANHPARKASPTRFAAGALCVLTGAVLLRVAVVLTSDPVLSDDIWRYVHDGATLRQGDNPYAIAPAEWPADEAPAPAAWLRINHPELVTIYQPVSLSVFAALDTAHAQLPEALRERDARGDRTFRLGFVLLDLLVVGLLLCQLHRMGRSPWWVSLYAWHPLAISEVAGSGHQDVLGIALLIAALLACDTARRAATRAGMGWAAACGALMAGAVMVKPIVLPVALLMGWRMRKGAARAPIVAALAGAGTMLAMYLPFALGESGLERMLETAETFTRHWTFNPSLHALAEALLGQKHWADGLMGAILATVVAVCMFTRWDVWRVTGVYLLAAVLLSSTVHPWYALWPLALVAVRFEPVTWALSLTVVLGYQAFLQPATYEPAAWVAWAQYVPVYATLIGALVWVRTRRRAG